MLLSWFLACSSPGPVIELTPVAPAAAGLPDLVILAVAGVRSDPESRGAERFLAPFRGEAARSFANAYAVSPNAFVSLATVLSGRYPTATPICGLTTAPGRVPSDAPWCNHWPESSPSLPAVLALYGYRTGLVTANAPGADELGKQFQDATMVQENWLDRRTDWAAVTDAARSWWQADTSRPRLLVVVTTDLDVVNRPDLLAAMHIQRDGQSSSRDMSAMPQVYGAACEVAGKGLHDVYASLGPADATRPRYTAVGGLGGVNLGEAAGPWQALREGSWSDILLNRTLHVPLLLIGPVEPQPEEQQIVELIDLLPTLLARTNAVAPAGLYGQDLLAPSFVTDPQATAFAEFGDMLAVRQGALMFSGRAFFFNRSSLDPELTDFFAKYADGDERFHLHDVVRDPYQRQDLLRQRPEDARRLDTLLLSIRNGAGRAPPTAMDARKVWELRMSPADGYW